MSPGHWFVDFGTEMMAGLTVTVTGGKAGAQMNVRLSEELLCNGCNESHAGGGGANTGKGCNTCNYNDTRKAILFPMRTGNTYEEIWTMNEGVSVFENHEYKLFRYNPDRSPRPGVFVFVAWRVRVRCLACSYSLPVGIARVCVWPALILIPSAWVCHSLHKQVR